MFNPLSHTAQALMAAVAVFATFATTTPTVAAEPAAQFAHDASAQAGNRYRSWLTKSFKADPGPKAAHRRRADRLMRDNAPKAAVRAYTNVLARTPEETGAWLGLARALLAQQTTPANRGRVAANANGAAYNAYRFAKDTAARAAALDVLATALERRAFWRPALEALKVRLAIAPDAAVEARFAALKRQRGFRVVDYDVASDAADPGVCVSFSEALKTSEPPTHATGSGDTVDVRSFVRLDGATPASVTAEARRLCIKGLTHGKRHRIQLRRGLAAAIGETLERDVDLEIYVPDRTPMVRMSSRGYVLPRTANHGLPIVSVNTDAVAVKIFRISSRALAREIIDGTFDRQIGTWDEATIRDRTGALVYAGTVETRNTRNAEVTTSVPVREALPERQPGVYVMTAEVPSTRETYGVRATQWFVISDLGLTAVSADDGVHVLVRRLSDAAPVANAQLTLIARNNDILAEITTDDDGHATFPGGITRGEGGLAPTLVTARDQGSDYGFLDLTRAAFDLTDRGVEGRNAPGPIDAFLYTDRGVYRAGDTVHAAALVRARNGRAADLPVTMIIARPDGVEADRITLRDQGAGGRVRDYVLPSGAMRGTWRMRVHIDPDAAPIAETAILVEDFVPERLDLKLGSAADDVAPGARLPVSLTGRFLYGPPAADMRVEGEVLVRAANTDAAHPGYRFGTDEVIAPVRATLTDLPRTDSGGQANLAVQLPPIADTPKPLTANVRIRLVEPGGRAIERVISRPVRATRARIGVKPLFKGGRIGDGETAAFEVIALDADGARAGDAKLAWRLVRLERVWQWFKRNGTWQYDSALVPAEVANGDLATGVDGAAARIAQALPWGRYRLEVAAADPTAQDAFAPSHVTFTSGWAGGADLDSPEVLDVSLDKDTFQAGETARLNISTRAGGLATVMVLGSGRLEQKTVAIDAGRSVIPVTFTQAWGPGAYATVFLHRAMDLAKKRMPTRALGTVWIARDRSQTTLDVRLDAPERTRSGRRVDVPFSVSRADAGSKVRLTVAAVDLGILNLTRFKPPQPADHFFGQMTLSAEIRDLYGRLIDGMGSEAGTLRSGGDADAGLQMNGAPRMNRSVALFSGLVEADADGRGRVSFDLPEFNGTVRLMAVAWTDTRVGSTTTDMIVRDPVTLTTAAPRFLARGDEARLRIDVHNVDGPDGAYAVTVTQAADGQPVTTLADTTFELAPNAREAVVATLGSETIGTHTLTTTVRGPDGLTVTRSGTFEVIAPAGDITSRRTIQLAPGESVSLGMSELAAFVPGTGAMTVSTGATAELDVPALLMSLERYPYGCTEQTISKALPLLYANDLSVGAGLAADDALAARIDAAIQSVAQRQDSSGAFGVWGPAHADIWLTAYAADFLSRAQEAGRNVPQHILARALDRLANVVAYTRDVTEGGRPLAYALYVLARNGRAPAAELRYHAQARLDDFKGPLAKAQLAAALTMIGDRDDGARIMAVATDALRVTEASPRRRDFGSRLRDRAALVALAAEAGFDSQARRLGERLGATFAATPRTSTQENAWLLLAARALSGSDRDTRLTVNGATKAGAFRAIASAGDLAAQGLRIANSGDAAARVMVTRTGASANPLPAAANGFAITRKLYRLDGTPLDDTATQTLAQNERVVVVLTATPEQRTGRILVVDRLPAGLEVENPSLVASGDIEAFAWLPKGIRPEHTEFRDDRVVAAYDLGRQWRGRSNSPGTLTVAFVARAVTPGTFAHPAAHVEDMYRPDRFARTTAARLVVEAVR